MISIPGDKEIIYNVLHISYLIVLERETLVDRFAACLDVVILTLVVLMCIDRKEVYNRHRRAVFVQQAQKHNGWVAEFAPLVHFRCV